MVDRITSSLAREAILAALKDQSSAAESVREDARKLFESALDPGSVGAPRRPAGASSASPVSALGEGLRAVDREVRGVEPDRLAKDLLSGEIEGLHEVALRINRAKISFDFAMEVRNKLIEAYRETMRMGV